MHCEDAGCIKICPSGALYRTAEGAVAYDRDKCIGCKLCVTACPFDVPRYDAENKVTKCHLCFDRIAAGMNPACVKTCPTGALKYGDRAELIDSAKKEDYKTIYGEQSLDGLGTIYAFKDEPKLYGMKENPTIPSSVVFWHNYLKPLSVIGLGGVVAAAAIHYLAIGPHKEEKEEV
jgi:formate dehydrogenase iron-sulfur subunit